MKIGILSLQGAVSEHELCIKRLNLEPIPIREKSDLDKLKGLIMPGGESTTLRKLLKNSGLWKIIKEMDIPIMGTSAGAILLGKCDDETFG